MGGEQQKTGEQLSFPGELRGEAPKLSGEWIEPPTAKRETESPASTEHLMEEVCERENLKKALKRVRSNKGSPGIDGMTVDELPGWRGSFRVVWWLWVELLLRYTRGRFVRYQLIFALRNRLIPWTKRNNITRLKLKQ